MPRYRKWLKEFQFNEDQRRTLTFGGLRLNSIQSRLELAPVNGAFPTTPDLFARTRVTRPEACRKWSGFFVVSRTHRTRQGQTITDARYRLNDGVVDRYWNAGAAEWVPASPNNWNTEQEVADNIDKWPTQALGVVVNLSTTNPKITPYVSEIRLMFDTDLVALEDYVIRSFVEDMREKMRAISVLMFDSRGETTVEFQKVLSAPYDVVEVDVVYNNTLDPMHMHPVTGWSYDAGTKTLSLPVQPSGNRVEVRFAWRPHVVQMQSQDYTEIAKIPVIVVEDAEVRFKRAIRGKPYVINKATGSGFAMEEGFQADIHVPLLLIAPSGRDLHVMGEEAMRYFANNSMLRARGQDEFYPVWPDSVYDDSTTATQKETFSARVQARILNAVFYPEDARPITGVLVFGVSGPIGPTIEVP